MIVAKVQTNWHSHHNKGETKKIANHIQLVFDFWNDDLKIQKINPYPPDAAADTKIGSTGLHFTSNTLQPHTILRWLGKK